MSEFGAAVAHLVEIATKGGKDWQLREAAYHVIQGFKPKDKAGTKSALAALGKAMKIADGRGEKVLLLVIGALVEAGASPEDAWPAVSYNLKQTLDGASRFAQACLDKSDEFAVDDAVKRMGPTLQKKMKKEFAAWDVLRSRCLSAVACLARSSELRHLARASKENLIAAAYPLEDAVEAVTFFSQIIKLIDDVPLLVLHPDSRRGFRLVMNDVTTNLELFVLLLDTLIGDPAKGMLPGTRPNAKAVRMIKDPDYAPKNPPEIKVFWNMVGWTGVLEDGTLPDPQSDAHAYWVWVEGVPIEIPIFEGERVILMQPPVMKRGYDVEPAFSALTPRMKLKSKVSGAEVDRLLAKMAKAAKKWRADHPPPPRGLPLPTPRR